MSGGLFVSALLRGIGHDLGPEETRKSTKLHGDYYVPLASHVRPLAGAIELLGELTRLTVLYAIATSGHMRSAGPSLNMLGVLDGPNPIITRDLAKRAKPDPVPFIAADKLGVQGSNYMVVGDSIRDLLTAQRARALGIGLLSGGYGDDRLLRAGAYRVYTDPRDLLHHRDEVGVRSPDEAPAT